MDLTQWTPVNEGEAEEYELFEVVFVYFLVEKKKSDSKFWLELRRINILGVAIFLDNVIICISLFFCGI